MSRLAKYSRIRERCHGAARRYKIAVHEGFAVIFRSSARHLVDRRGLFRRGLCAWSLRAGRLWCLRRRGKGQGALGQCAVWQRPRKHSGHEWMTVENGHELEGGEDRKCGIRWTTWSRWFGGFTGTILDALVFFGGIIWKDVQSTLVLRRYHLQ